MELIERRDLLDARRAPGRPKVENEEFTSKISELSRLAVFRHQTKCRSLVANRHRRPGQIAETGPERGDEGRRKAADQP